jgi:hypothetical protein
MSYYQSAIVDTAVVCLDWFSKQHMTHLSITLLSHAEAAPILSLVAATSFAPASDFNRLLRLGRPK